MLESYWTSYNLLHYGELQSLYLTTRQPVMRGEIFHHHTTSGGRFWWWLLSLIPHNVLGGHLENRSLRPPEGSKVKKNYMNELLSSIRTWWCVTLIPLDCIWEFSFFDSLVFDDFQKRGRQKFRPHFWEGHGGQIFSLTSQEPKTIKKTSFELHGHGIWDIYPTIVGFADALADQTRRP